MSQIKNPKVDRGPGRQKKKLIIHIHKKRKLKSIVENQGKKEEENKVGNSQVKKTSLNYLKTFKILGVSSNQRKESNKLESLKRKNNRSID